MARGVAGEVGVDLGRVARVFAAEAGGLHVEPAAAHVGAEHAGCDSRAIRICLERRLHRRDAGIGIEETADVAGGEEAGDGCAHGMGPLRE